MEHLSVLEQKLLMLIESKKIDNERLRSLEEDVERLKAENAQLKEEAGVSTTVQAELAKAMDDNTQLRSHIDKLEETLLVRHQSLEMLNQERELTKMAVDDLIKDIDMIIGKEQ